MQSEIRTLSTPTLIKRFAPYFKPYWKMLVLDLLCAALTTMCDVALPLIVRNITQLAVDGAAALTVEYVLRIGVFYIGLRVVDAAANYYMTSRGHIMGSYIERDMRLDLFTHLQTLGFAYYSNAKVGQIMARITSDLFEVTEFAHHCPEEFFIAGIKITVAFRRAVCHQPDANADHLCRAAHYVCDYLHFPQALPRYLSAAAAPAG